MTNNNQNQQNQQNIPQREYYHYGSIEIILLISAIAIAPQIMSNLWTNYKFSRYKHWNATFPELRV